MILPQGLQSEHVIEAISLGIVLGISKVTDHIKGKRRDKRRTSWQEDTTHQLTILSTVVGVDNSNGIRGEVKRLSSEMSTLREEVSRIQGRLDG